MTQARFRIVFIAIILARLFGAYQSTYAADQDLKFRWRLDEGSGISTADSSGNTPSYPGTLYNGPTWITGGGLSFDGINDYTRTNSPIPNSMGVSNQAYTLSATVRVAPGETDGNIIHISDGANGIGWCISMLHIKEGKFRAIGWQNNLPVIAASTVNAVPGEWYSIANTWSPETDSLDLYVNGELVASSPMSTFQAADQQAGNASVYIFAGLGTGSCSNDQGFFKGDVKDVAIYSRAITEEEAINNSNESIADAPYVTSFSPLDDATNVALNANLVATFSTSTMATSTGVISIYKTSDNSLFESIPVSSSKISIDGAEVTINPTTTFAESTGYYINILGSALVNATGTAYAGTVASTTWNFITGDFSFPTPLNVSATSTATTSTNIIWTTDELSSTRVVYGLTSSYGTTTPTTNTSPRVTSHTASLSNLLSCTTYHYAAVSVDASGNTATSSDSTFTTSECEGGDTEPNSVTSNDIDPASGGTTTASDGGKNFSVIVPPYATNASSTMVIQIKALPNAPILESLGRPNSATHEVGVTSFDVKAIINGDTILDSFDIPITIEYEYTNEEVSQLNESSLWLYHYTHGEWIALDDCDLDEEANKISCTTQSFSIFSLFGNPQSATPVTSSSVAMYGGTSISSRVANLISMGMLEEAEALKRQWPHLFGTTDPDTATLTVSDMHVRNLTLTYTGEDVRKLQFLLNKNGFPLASTGVGSVGNETEYFGTLTRAALAEYQAAHSIAPAVGYFGPITRAQMKSAGISGLWW